MPFHIIKGSFFAENYSPDGDTIRFKPDNEAKLSLLSGPPANVNFRGHVSIRFEGIDALETHYGALKQPPPFADQATDFVLSALGISDVQWSHERRSIVSADDGKPGYILARATDRYNRVIAFVFGGVSDANDGDSIFLEPAQLSASVNYLLASHGLAFATYYWGLFADLRSAITEAVGHARSQSSGIHSVDRTNDGAEISSLKSITDDFVIMPKLFRRLTTYIEEKGKVSGFKAALEASAEPVFDLRDQNFTHFDTFVEESGNSIRLTRSPEELVFDPMPQRIATDFPALLRSAANPSSKAIAENIVSASTLADVAHSEAQLFAQRVRNLQQ